ncbi:MAG: glutaredoxin family protein [Acidobacteriaceae bacterium]
MFLDERPIHFLAFQRPPSAGPATGSICQPHPIPANYNHSMHEVIVYSRVGCHLCDVVKDTLAKLETEATFHWHVVDIDADPSLRALYNEEVPVVFINGRKAFKYHLDPKRFLQILASS